MSNNTARLVDASAGGSHGKGVSATLARGEFEEALKAGRGPVELSLDVKRLSGGQPDVEAHTLDIALERRELKKLLKKSDGDAITLTFDENELLEALGGDDDVEAHGVRERALVLTVAAATAAAGTGAYVASTMGHHTTTPAVTQAGYLTTAAAQALGTSVQPVSDAATGGYIAPTIVTSDSVAPIDAGSSAANPSIVPQQVSDAASGGGYQAGDATYSAGAPGGYLSSETAQVIGGTTDTPEQVSDAATGGYTTPSEGGYLTTASAEALSASTQPVSDAATGGYAQTPEQISDAASGAGYDAAAPGGYLTSATAEAIGASTQPVSDAASGGGYTQTPEQISDAATGGYEAPTPRSGPVSSEAATDQSDAVSRSTANTASDQGDAVSRYTANTSDQSDAVSRAVANAQTDESDAVSRYVGNTASDEQGYLTTASAEALGASQQQYLTTSEAEATQGSVQPVSDAATGGFSAAAPEQVSDAASGGGFPTQHAEAQAPSVTLPEAVGAAIAGGAALLITGVALQRRR